MLSSFIKLVIAVFLFAMLFLISVSVYSCVESKPEKGPALPDSAFTVYIENTGNLILSDSVKQEGSTPRTRVYTVDGFWEATTPGGFLGGKQRFVYKATTLILDESIFGIITVKPR